MSSQNARAGKQRYLEVAEQLFTEHGYQSVSIRDIAKACKVTNAALYYHFPSKAALYDEVMELHTEHLRTQMQKAAVGDGSTRERISAILSQYALVVADRRSPLFSFRHRRDGISKKAAHKQMKRIFHVILEPLDNVLRQAGERGELRLLPEAYSAASLLMGMLHGMMHHNTACGHGKVSSGDIQLIVELFLVGFETT